jgi:hypothetical protein
MSDTGPPAAPEPAPPGPPPEQRHGCLTAFMVIAGLIMLLPGVCALYFGSFRLAHPDSPDTFTPFIVVGLLVGLGGVMLLWAALRRHQN